jgi:hypothetical protein
MYRMCLYLSAQGGAAIAPPTTLIEEDKAASNEIASGINLNAVPSPGPFSNKSEPEEVEKPLPGASMGLAYVLFCLLGHMSFIYWFTDPTDLDFQDFQIKIKLGF